MTNPYKMFKTKEEKPVAEKAILDYGDFRIHIKFGGASNRSFLDAYKLKMRVFDRRVKLAEDGRLTDEQLEALDAAKTLAVAELYADHIIVGWDNVKDEKDKLIEYNRANVVKLLTDLDQLFADIIQQSANAGNFAEKVKEAEQKN